MAMSWRVAIARASLRSTSASTRTAALVRAFSSRAAFQHAADRFVAEIPEEHAGLNVEFNWSLADDDVTPHGANAFRNLAWTSLSKYASAEKASTTPGAAVSAQEVDVSLSLGAFEATLESVADHLSMVDTLFTHDGAVGSFADDRSRVRVVSDSAKVALFVQNLLVKVPIKDPHAARPVVVYVATLGAFASATPQIQLLTDNDDEGRAFVKVVVSGNVALESIQQAIGLAKTRLMEQNESESLVVPADVLLQGDKTALVFGASAATRGATVSRGALYGAHLNIWNSAGLTSVFGGAVVDSSSLNKTGKNQKLAAVAKDQVAVHVPCHNLVNAPAAAIFVGTAGSAKAGPITPAQAKELLQKVAPSADADKFEALLTKAGTQSFVVANASEIDATLAKV